MAVPVEGTTVTVGDTSTSTDTVQSVTTTAGQTYMVVGIGITNKSESVVTLTFGATSLARIVRNASGSNQCIELWGGVVPESTTANVTVHYTGLNANAVVSITPWSGVNTVAPIGAGFSAFINSPGTLSVDVTDSKSYARVICRLIQSNGDAATTGAGQTDDFTVFGDGAGQIIQRGSSKLGVDGTSTMQYTSVGTAGGTAYIAAVAVNGSPDGLLMGACVW